MRGVMASPETNQAPKMVVLSGRLSVPPERSEEVQRRVEEVCRQIAEGCGGEFVDAYVHPDQDEKPGRTAIPADNNGMYEPPGDLPDDLANEL